MIDRDGRIGNGEGTPDRLPGVAFVCVRCPGCGSSDVPVHTTIPPTEGNPFRTRYHRCRGCGGTFKSIESTS